MKKIIYALIVLCALQACKKSRSDIGQVVFKETKNKVFKSVEEEAFIAVFKQTLEEKKASLKNPKFITAFYESNNYDPVLINTHLPKDQLKEFSAYLSKSNDHGISPEVFNANTLSALVNKLYEKDSIKTVEQAYKVIAEVELMAANSLIDYTNALKYGLISPRKIYASYYTETKRPDSTSMMEVFQIGDLKSYLDSIQPKGAQYAALQKGLSSGIAAPGLTQEETAMQIKVNMERLRWKNRSEDKKFVIVNIPDYRLDVYENGKSVLHEGLCW